MAGSSKREGGAFSRAAASASQRAPDSAKPNSSVDPLTQRLNRISETQKVVKTTRLLVDPEECKLWDRHNRRFDLLNEEMCADLIESFKSSGQSVPAIVRRIKTQGKVRYEIIAGARRLWTVLWLRANNYPDFQLLIEVKDLTDEAAFRESNLENLDRKDISDYERALDYNSALGFYYHGKQAEMAARLGKSEMWVSRYLALSKVPREVADAYSSLSDLKLRHAPELLKLLEPAKSREAVLALCVELRESQVSLREAGDPSKLPNGAEVLRRLKAAGQGAAKRSRSQPSRAKPYGPKGNPHLEVKSVSRSGLTIHVPRSSGAEVEELVKSFRKCLEENYEKKA